MAPAYWCTATCIQLLSLERVKNAEACSNNAGMLARDGRCKTLDASGDGYVRAETCVTLLLEALDGGQQAAAILKGSAVNQVKLTTLRGNRPSGASALKPS